MDEYAVKQAYDTIRPSADGRKRMIENILSVRGNVSPGSMVFRRPAVIAAVLCMLLLAGCAAYAYVQSLESLKLADLEATDWIAEGAAISPQGPADSPCNLAWNEYYEFAMGYDPDGTIRSTIEDVHNAPGIPSPYTEYACYTQEMMEKLDEIAAKYSLTLLGEFIYVNEFDELYEAAGIETIFQANILFNTDMDWSYHRGEGTFKIIAWGKLLGLEPQWPHRFTYFYLRNKTDSFHKSEFLPIGDIESYEQWDYTTEEGQELLLAVSDNYALIITETEESYITIQLINDVDGGTQFGLLDVDNPAPEPFNKKAIEAIAEIFDFSQV